MLRQTTITELARHNFMLAVLVSELSILLHTTKPKKKKTLAERVLAKFKKAHWQNTPENIDQIFHFMLSLGENEGIADMEGLGGSRAKTVEELLVQFELHKTEKSDDLLVCRLWN